MNALQQELVCKDHMTSRPLQLYEWASQAIPSVNFAYCTVYYCEILKAVLENRFFQFQNVPGT